MRLGVSINTIALSQKVSRITVWKINKMFRAYGINGLKDHKAGRPCACINANFCTLAKEQWELNRCGARKLHAILKRKGHNVSRRQIEKILIKAGIQKSVPSRKKPRKYKRYEWPLPNYMWHTDWHVIKSKRMNGENIVVYIDDCSRMIMGYCTGSQTTKNSIFALYKAISDHGVMPFCINSDRGTQYFPNKKDKNGSAVHAFQEVLQELGILFIPSKVRHPQTNGKNERFFGILDKEFDERFTDLEHFIRWYNTERLSEAIDYMTPAEAYQKRL